jgi:hypothetical protein
MDRRRFLFGLSVASLPVLFADIGFADETCVPLMPNVARCTAGIRSEMIHVTAQQKMNQWCWAACIEMVFKYYGYDVPQARIVHDAWGQVVNMPGQPAQILASLNRIWVAEDGRRFRAYGDALSANAQTAVIDLQNDRPLIIGALGHATVLTALTSDVNQINGAWAVIAAIVRDPWPGRGRRVLTPQEWYNITFACRIAVQAID